MHVFQNNLQHTAGDLRENTYRVRVSNKNYCICAMIPAGLRILISSSLHFRCSLVGLLIALHIGGEFGN